MKKIMIPALAALASVSAFAEDPAISTPEGILSASKTALEGLLTTALPYIGALVVGGLTLWGVFKLIRLVMKAFGFGAAR